MFVEILPLGIEGLLHISQIDKERVEKASDLFKEGDIIEVKYMGKDAGEQIVRDMLSRKSDYNPILFIDDDPNKKGNTIHGLKVVGGIDTIKSVMKENDCYSVLIAIPSIDSENLRRIYQSLEKNGCKEIKILPSVDSIVDGKVSSKDVKNIDITDLLGREKVSYDIEFICEYLKGENVLITGAAGSIGSEIVNQVIKFNASKVYATRY